MSSDLHASWVLERLREQKVGASPLEAFGIGGPGLRRAGLEILAPMESLRAMGTTEVVGKLAELARARETLLAAVARRRPEVALLCDYPEFHLKLAEDLRRLGVPCIQYIPPKIWVWRNRRWAQLKRRFTRVLSILPFELESRFLGQLGSLCEYVGNPLTEEIGEPRDPSSNGRAARLSKLGLSPDREWIALFAGSRPAEIRAHLPVLKDFVRSRKEHGKFGFLWAVPEGMRDEFGLEDETPEERIIEARSLDVLRAADFGVIKSGTSTLEAAYLGCPHVVIYRPSAVTGWLFRNLVRYRGPVALSNLVAAHSGHQRWDEEFTERVYPELLMEAFTTENLNAALDRLRESPAAQGAASLRIQQVLGRGRKISSRVAEICVEVATTYRGIPLQARWSNLLLSSIWSCLNHFARRFRESTRPRRLGARRVVSVGNIEAGGTGKSPIVRAIAAFFTERGLSVAVLSRGVGRRSEREVCVAAPEDSVEMVDFGDEALELRTENPKVWIGVGADRERTYSLLRKRRGSDFDVVILDDGLQQFGLARDLDLVLRTSRSRAEAVFREWRAPKDSLEIWSKGAVLPAGWKPRMDLDAVRVVWDARAARNGAPFDLNGLSVRILTSVAIPAAVHATVERLGAKVIGVDTVRDHGRFEPSQNRRVSESQEGEWIAVTGKDAVKLPAGRGLIHVDERAVLPKELARRLEELCS